MDTYHQLANASNLRQPTAEAKESPTPVNGTVSARGGPRRGGAKVAGIKYAGLAAVRALALGVPG